MIAEPLATLADRLRPYRDAGVAMEGDAVSAVVALLDLLAEEALAVERRSDFYPRATTQPPWGWAAP